MISFIIAAGNVVMNILLIAFLCLSFLFLLILYFCLDRLNERNWERCNKEPDKENFEIRVNRIAICGVVTFVILFGLLTLLCPILYIAKVADNIPVEEMVGFTCSFGICFIIAIIFLVLLKRWRVCVSNDKIVHVPLFGKKREFSWNDISNVVCVEPFVPERATPVKVYLQQCNKPEIVLNAFLQGGEILIKKLIKLGKISR